MATRRRLWARAVAAGLAGILLSAPVVTASAADDVAFTIRDPRVTESSGLTRDTDADVYWTVNDSGDEGTVYGVRPDGNVEGIVGFRAQPRDVEAVAMHDGALYVADIGDNGSRRDFVTVYWLNSPTPDNKTVPYRAYDFSYPDGPHDAETLLVDGNGRLYVVTKGLKGGIYQAPRNPSRQGVNKLIRVADAPAFVTDGAFLDDDRIVLRTYVSLEVLDASTYETLARDAAPVQKQGESVSVTLDGKALLVGSEGKNSQVLQVDVPSKIGEAPSAASTPPSTSSPTASPSPSSASPDDSDDTNVDDEAGGATTRTGTILALSLAAFVALVAGVVVAAVRKP